MSQSAVLGPWRRSRPGSRRERSALGRVRPRARTAGATHPGPRTKPGTPAAEHRGFVGEVESCAHEAPGLARKAKSLAHGPKSLAAKAPGLAREVPEPHCGQKARRERLRGSAASFGGLGPRRKASRPALGASHARRNPPSGGVGGSRKAGYAALTRPPASHILPEALLSRLGWVKRGQEGSIGSGTRPRATGSPSSRLRMARQSDIRSSGSSMRSRRSR